MGQDDLAELRTRLIETPLPEDLELEDAGPPLLLAAPGRPANLSDAKTAPSPASGNPPRPGPLGPNRLQPRARSWRRPARVGVRVTRACFRKRAKFAWEDISGRRLRY